MEAHDNGPYAALLDTEKDTEKDAGWFSVDPVKSQMARELANRKMWQFILAGAGAGIGARGLQGLSRMLTPSKKPKPVQQRHENTPREQ